MRTFAEKERMCEMAFEDGGPFWHVYTDGSIMVDLFSSEDEKREGMIVLAVCAVLFREAELVTFELMHNHVHLIMRGDRQKCLEFFDLFKRRLKRLLQQRRFIDWGRFEAQILSVETLKALRNEIIYTNRNAYVASGKYTPFSYPWGGGWAYFSPVIEILPVVSVREMGCTKARELTHYRDVNDIADLKFVGDVPYIPSFCRVDIGQSMFRDARSYFHALTRNAEAYSQIASRLKDTVFLKEEQSLGVPDMLCFHAKV